MKFVLYNLTLSELTSLKQAFQLYSNNTSTIPAAEFEYILASLMFTNDLCQIQNIVKDVDRNDDRLIDFDEFVTAMVKYIPPMPSPETYTEEPSEMDTMEEVTFGNNEKQTTGLNEQEILQCFQAFDTNHDNRISESELIEALKSLGEHFSQHEVKAMMEEADINGDGYIDFNEFKRLVPLY